MAAASTHSDAPTNEKLDVEQQSEVPQQKAKKGLFSKSKKPKVEAEEVKEKEKADDVALDALEGAPKPQKDVKPASFTSLFRCVPLTSTQVSSD